MAQVSELNCTILARLVSRFVFRHSAQVAEMFFMFVPGDDAEGMWPPTVGFKEIKLWKSRRLQPSLWL